MKIVIDDVNSPENDWSSKSMLVEDLKKELQAISQWQMTFTRREGNKAVHALAKWASKNNVTHQWLCTAP